MRRLAACLAIPVLLLAVPSARAQQGPAVTLHLVYQTRWNDPRHTTLVVDVRARNGTAQPLDQLSLFVGIDTPTGSRTEYQQSLRSVTGSPIYGNTFLEPGTLQPNRSAAFRLSLALPAAIQQGDSGIYPMNVELRSREQTEAVLRSPVIFLSKNPPLTPLDLAWTFVLSAPITLEPDGFHSTWLQRELAPGGGLHGELAALAGLVSLRSPPYLDVAVAPQLVDQLEAMRHGYTLRSPDGTTRVPAGHDGATDADQALATLRQIADAPFVQLSALPYASPSFPALLSAGLAGDVPQQLAIGREDVASALGRQPATGLLYPPGSQLDQASLWALHQNAVGLLLVDSGTVRQPAQPLGYARLAVAALSVGTSTPLDAIAPDGGVQQLLDGQLPHEDPHLAVQAALGELAQIWLEQPSVSRGVALTFSEKTNLPSSFFRWFVRSVDLAPWLHPVTATTLAAAHPPRSDQAASLTLLPTAKEMNTESHGTAHLSVAGSGYRATFVADPSGASERRVVVTGLGAVTPLASDLQRVIFRAEAGQFATQEGVGLAYLSSITDRLTKEFHAVSPDTSSIVTLTSRNGTIPVPIRNLTGHPVRVRVDLEGGGRLSVRDDSRVVTIPGGGVTLTFGVQAQTTGRFPVQVVVSTPDGRTALGPPARLIIRSTAYNRVALVITIGAALFLLALWTRRFVPWTKR